MATFVLTIVRYRHRRRAKPVKQQEQTFTLNRQSSLTASKRLSLDRFCIGLITKEQSTLLCLFLGILSFERRPKGLKLMKETPFFGATLVPVCAFNKDTFYTF